MSFGRKMLKKEETIPRDSYTMRDIGIGQVRQFLGDNFGVSIGNDLIITQFNSDRYRELKSYPFRFESYLAIFCEKGRLELEINLDYVTVPSGSLLLVVPGQIVRLAPERSEPSEFVAVAASQDFIQSLRLDFNKILSESLELLSCPILPLMDGDREKCRHFLNLLVELSSVSTPGHRDAILALSSSLFYFVGGIWQERLKNKKEYPSETTARTRLVFERFMHLVTEYHTSRRDMAFYADKMCLTPKYLSKVIKQVSGRSAPDWIDSFVILEAKNRLKYSSCTIKEIVYELNFPNQSVFYKFFKAHTGLTPTRYRNS